MSRARNRSKFFTRSESERVLTVAMEQSVREYTMILLAYRHGMRQSDVGKRMGFPATG